MLATSGRPDHAGAEPRHVRRGVFRQWRTPLGTPASRRHGRSHGRLALPGPARRRRTQGWRTRVRPANPPPWGENHPQAPRTDPKPWNKPSPWGKKYLASLSTPPISKGYGQRTGLEPKHVRCGATSGLRCGDDVRPTAVVAVAVKPPLGQSTLGHRGASRCRVHSIDSKQVIPDPGSILRGDSRAGPPARRVGAGEHGRSAGPRAHRSFRGRRVPYGAQTRAVTGVTSPEEESAR